MLISRAVKRGMTLKGYKSQWQLAEAADLPQGMISQLLTGKITKPRHETLSKLACAFGVQVSEFIKWGEE